MGMLMRLARALICMETLLFYQDILMWTQLKVSGWNGQIGSGTSRRRADPAGIRQLARIKAGLVRRDRRWNSIRGSRRSVRKLITPAKWSPAPEPAARSPWRWGRKVGSIFHQGGGRRPPDLHQVQDLLIRLEMAGFNGVQLAVIWLEFSRSSSVVW